MERDADTCDAVVVGAGFAGLSAARELVAAGLRVTVLEARDRVGGRALTRWLPDGTQLDLGGQWVGPTQHRIMGLISGYGIETYPTPRAGRPVITIGGARLDDLPAEVTGLLSRLDALSGELSTDAPWSHPRAREWDGLTLASWLAGQPVSPAAARYVGRVVAGGLLSLDAGEASLLETLFYLASGGGSEVLLGFEGGAQALRVRGGAQSVAQHMADALPPGIVRSEEPVRRLAHGPDGVLVTTDKGPHAALHAIVAVPPVLAGRIDYAPALPERRDGLTQRMPAGHALKTHAVYDRPFWREAGLSAVSTSDTGVLTETVDNTPPGSPRAVLTGFTYGHDARALRLLGAKERERAVLGRLAELFGESARRPGAFVEFDWCAEPWTRGCFSGHLVPGAWTGYGDALRAPVGPLHWAGTETATVWNGYFDGAVESGVRAAREVLAARGALGRETLARDAAGNR